VGWVDDLSGQTVGQYENTEGNQTDSQVNATFRSADQTCSLRHLRPGRYCPNGTLLHNVRPFAPDSVIIEAMKTLEPRVDIPEGELRAFCERYHIRKLALLRVCYNANKAFTEVMK